LQEEYRLNKRVKESFSQTKESLLRISNSLVQAENHLRDGNIKQCFQTYSHIAQEFESLRDYETASYFYKRCLDVSIDNKKKYLEGEPLAYKGLGICEERVHNIFEAMNYLETALGKACDESLTNIEKKVSEDLVRVY